MKSFDRSLVVRALAAETVAQFLLKLHQARAWTTLQGLTGQAVLMSNRLSDPLSPSGKAELFRLRPKNLSCGCAAPAQRARAAQPQAPQASSRKSTAFPLGEY